MRNTITFAGRLPVLCMMTGVALASFATLSQAASDDYHLGVMDKLRIRVAEWQPADGSIKDWDVVGGDYTVGPGGTLSLPFLGDLPAAGKTTGEVAAEIGEQLRSKFALRNLPSASVEISEFRPVFLSGDIDKPGQYPYAPNLTVLKAVSLAGGLRRSDSGQRFARDFINAKGDEQVYDSQQSRLYARRARLLAEISNAKTIEIPVELKSVKNAPNLIESEAALMKSETERYQLQLKSLTDLKTMLQSEIESLAQKADTQQKQLELVSDNRDKMSKLTEQGITSSTRMLTLSQNSTDIQSTLLDIDTSSLRAKQDLSKAEQDEINLKNDWIADRTQDLQNTNAELEKLGFQLNTSRQLMSEAIAQSAEALQFDPNSKSATIKYTVVRDQGQGPKEISVDENTQLHPGDVIKVKSELLMQ